MARQRHESHVSDSSSCSDSDDSGFKSSRTSKKKVLGIGAGDTRTPQILKAISCKLASANVQLLLLSLIYGTGILILLGALYMFGPAILSTVKCLLSYILPDGWMKSTWVIVDEALAKYSADRLGMADYALESAGGSVLCNSETYFLKEGALYSMFGIPLWYHSSNPRAVIQPEVQPGQCWAMDGNKGYVTIQLALPIVVQRISLEHIPGSLATTSLNSAAKDFQIEGKELDLNSPPIVLGRFTYHIDQDQPIQMYTLKDGQCLRETQDQGTCGPNKRVFGVVTLRVLSNHGNPDYTCIYRFRVHGQPQYSPIIRDNI